MTTRSNISSQGSYNMDPRPRIGDDDGVSTKAMNIAIFLLISILLILSVATSVLAQGKSAPAVQEYTTEALLYMNEGQTAEALDKLHTVEQQAPSASIEHLLGVCYFNQKQYDTAILHLEKAAEDLVEEGVVWNPMGQQAPIHALNYLGRSYFDQGMYGKAAEVFSQFLVSLYVSDDTATWLIEQTEEVLTLCEELQSLTAAKDH